VTLDTTTRPPSGAGPAREVADHTGSRGSRLLGVITLVGVATLVVFGLVLSPADVNQGDSVRLMYIHVPAAIVAFLAFGVTAVGSIMWLVRKSTWWDLMAASSAEIGIIGTAICLVTGMVWGRPTWGAYWIWDARLTTTALLFLLFCGYLAIRRIPAEPAVRNQRAAVAGLVAFIDVPIVHFAVDWWRSLHQPATISRLDPTIEGLMLFTLMLGMVVFLLGYLWLMIHRFRIAWMEDRIDDVGLDRALDERRAEGQPQPVAAAETDTVGAL
jgi:heme exporter protein C